MFLFIVLQSNQKRSCCSLGAVIMLPQGGHKAICPPVCSRALGVPTKGSDKPFPELQLAQRGSDKLGSRCCASLFLSSGFKAKLRQNHRAETPRWTQSTACNRAVSMQPVQLTHRFPILPCPPSPSGTGTSFWGHHAAGLLCLCTSVILGPQLGSQVPGWSRMGVGSDAKQGVAEPWSVECVGAAMLGQSCWYHGKAEGMNLFPSRSGNAG